MKQIWVCNVKIDDTTAEAAVAFALEVRREPCWVVTPNAVMLDACRRDRAYAAMLNRATLSLADGAGVLLAARKQKTPLCERVAGIEFGEVLLREAAKNGLRVFLLGGGADVAERAAERLCQRFEGLTVCGTYWGYFQKEGEEDRRVTEYICSCRPDILLVCFGFPLQERWIEAHLDLLKNVRVVAGLGGSLDVWAGNVKRAPKLVSRLGLEWAWRMLLEPKRIKNLPAILRFAIQKQSEPAQK